MPDPEPTPRDQAVTGLVHALTPLLVRRFRDQLYRALQPHCPIPLRDGTYPLLVALGHGPADATSISEQVGVDRSVIIKQAAVLAEAGLLERARHATRSRIVVYQLTPAGHHVAERMQAGLLDLVAAAEQHLSTHDLTTAATVLNTLHTHLQST